MAREERKKLVESPLLDPTTFWEDRTITALIQALHAWITITLLKTLTGFTTTLNAMNIAGKTEANFLL